eukprot:g1994.t1
MSRAPPCPGPEADPDVLAAWVQQMLLCVPAFARLHRADDKLVSRFAAAMVAGGPSSCQAPAVAESRDWISPWRDRTMLMVIVGALEVIDAETGAPLGCEEPGAVINEAGLLGAVSKVGDDAHAHDSGDVGPRAQLIAEPALLAARSAAGGGRACVLTLHARAARTALAQAGGASKGVHNLLSQFLAEQRWLARTLLRTPAIIAGALARADAARGDVRGRPAARKPAANTHFVARLARLCGAGVVSYPAGSLLCRAGAPATHGYLVRRGQLRAVDRNGALVRLIRRGQDFGGTALMEGGSSAVTLHSEGNAEVKGEGGDEGGGRGAQAGVALVFRMRRRGLLALVHARAPGARFEARALLDALVGRLDDVHMGRGAREDLRVVNSDAARDAKRAMARTRLLKKLRPTAGADATGLWLTRSLDAGVAAATPASSEGATEVNEGEAAVDGTSATASLRHTLRGWADGPEAAATQTRAWFDGGDARARRMAVRERRRQRRQRARNRAQVCSVRTDPAAGAGDDAAEGEVPSLGGRSCDDCTAASTLRYNGTNLGNGHIQHLTGIATADECCLKCRALRDSPLGTCTVWEHAAEGGGSCWLKDNANHRMAQSDRVSGSCEPLPPPSPPPSPLPPSPPVAVAVAATVRADAPLARSGDGANGGFASFALDWWGPSEGCHPEGWGHHANILSIDLASPKLRMLVAALGPGATLRIGGSKDKDVGYAMGDAFPGSLPYGGAGCRPDLCLNSSRWDAINAFAAATGSRLVFGLSYPISSGSGGGGGGGGGSSDDGDSDSGVWNSSNAEALFAYTRAAGHAVYGFELGEELTRFQLGTRAFDDYVTAYRKAAALLRDAWAGEGGSNSSSRPLLMGPCPGMSWPQLQTWFPAFLNGTRGALDAAVYHSYNQVVVAASDKDGRRLPRTLYLNLTAPSDGGSGNTVGASAGDTGWQADAMRSFVAAQNPGLPLWLGEGGPHNGGGGGPGLGSHTFLDTFYYLDALGVTTEMGHFAFGRQTLAGGNYELLRCSSAQLGGDDSGGVCDFEPRPSYYVALLWHRLMDSRALAVAAAGGGADGGAAAAAQFLRVHAHCYAPAGMGSGGNGSVAFSVSNSFDPAYDLGATPSFRLRFNSSAAAQLGGTRFDFLLRSANASAGIFSQSVALNGGAPLRVAPGDAQGAAAALPRLEPVVMTGAAAAAALDVPPSTVGFVVFPDARVPACM